MNKVKKFNSNNVYVLWVKISGDLITNFYFKSKTSYVLWRESELLRLQSKYSNIRVDLTSLPGFTKGDYCSVAKPEDEGNKYLIIGISEIGKNRVFVDLKGRKGKVALCLCY